MNISELSISLSLYIINRYFWLAVSQTDTGRCLKQFKLTYWKLSVAKNPTKQSTKPQIGMKLNRSLRDGLCVAFR